MKFPCFFFGLLLILMLIVPGSSFVVKDGENIVIDTPINDDLLVSGGTVTVTAPVRSITFAGGSLTVNAPVERNLIGAGGQILVNAPVGADLIVAGGQITVMGNVTGKVLAAGGKVIMNGNASNVAISGGSVDLGAMSHVTGDALISASECKTDGIVEGRLDAQTDTRGDGSPFNPGELVSFISTAVLILDILMTIGMIILGVILLHLIPSQMKAVITTLREKPLLSLIFGVAGSVLAFIIGIILLVSVIGIPIALVIGLATLLGLILSTIYTGAALGGLIGDKLEKNYSLIPTFLIGFIILQIIFFIPLLGFIIEIFAIFIGFGALLLMCWNIIESGA